MLALGVLFVLAGVWIVVTGLLARSQLENARADVDHLRSHLQSGDLTAADRDRAQLAGHAHRARELTSGPAWAIAAHLPGGAPAHTARGLASAVDDLSQGPLAELIDLRRTLDPATLRAADGRIDVARIAAAAPSVARADAQLTRNRAAISALPGDTWLGTVDSARTSVLDQLDPIAATVHDAELATAIVPKMLGVDGPRRYFVAFQNPAESRGTGGLPGAFAIVRADAGKITFERFESDSALDGVSAGVDLGSDFDQLYAPARSTALYVNSNISPNFPYAARIWAGMWQRKTGERLDGAVALDPQALAQLLAVTGPATLPGGKTVSADELAPLTEVGLYAQYGSDATARRAALLGVARAVSSTIVDSHAPTRAMLDAARQGAVERRVLVWSAEAATERLLAPTPVSGAVPRTQAPYVGPVVVNDGGDKLDYYLQRAVTWTRTGCGPSRSVTATVRLANTAPTDLPRSATDRSDHPPYPISPGDNRIELAWFGTSGGVLTSATLDGKAVGATAGRELGHPVFTVDVEIPRGATRTVVFHLAEPAGTGNPVALRQPLVASLQLAIDDARC